MFDRESPTPGPELHPAFPTEGEAPGPFSTPRLLRGPHVQTLAGRAVRSLRGARYQREEIGTPDGDRLSLDWSPPPGEPDAPASRAAPVLLVLHGLEGSSSSGYVRATARAAAAAGIRLAALNFRSCDGRPNLLARSYHSGETGDPGFVLETIRARYPGAPLGAVGYSLGGNVLLRLLAEQGAGSPLAAAAAVSVPFDLAASAAHLERPAARLYSTYFLRSLRRKAKEKARRFPGAFDAGAAARAKTLRAFDEAVTAPVHGFAGADDYYERCSSIGVLDRIRVPTLILHAEDDPFVPARTLGRVRAVDNRWLLPSFSSAGGHLGFLGSAPGARTGLWAEAVVIRFLARRLGA